MLMLCIEAEPEFSFGERWTTHEPLLESSAEASQRIGMRDQGLQGASARLVKCHQMEREVQCGRGALEGS